MKDENPTINKTTDLDYKRCPRIGSTWPIGAVATERNRHITRLKNVVFASLRSELFTFLVHVLTIFKQ